MSELEHKVVSVGYLPKLATDAPERGFAVSLLADMLDANPQMYAEMQTARVGHWRKNVRRFEQDPDDFYNAWHYLNEHPLFWYLAGTRTRPAEAHEKSLQDSRGFPEAVEISVMKVDPETSRVEEPESRNTKTEIWYEICMTHWPSQYDDVRVHVYTLDGGGDTYEEAIVKAAKQVHETYGNDRRVFTEQHGERSTDE